MIKDKKDIVYIDFQGWPIYKQTLKEMLVGLGFTLNKETNKYEMDADTPILKVYPRILEDDGMGYGVNERWVTECSAYEESDTVNIFAEKQCKEQVDEYFKENEEDDGVVKTDEDLDPTEQGFVLINDDEDSDLEDLSMNEILDRVERGMIDADHAIHLISKLVK